LRGVVEKMSVFTKQKVDEALIQEYFTRNKRKKEDEKWLKSNGNAIKKALADTPKSLIGDYAVIISVPDMSNFNRDKTLEYLEKNHSDILKNCTVAVLDEEVLSQYIEDGTVDIKALKEYAWEETQGSPRLLITKKEEQENA
jgi:hypothetical protein